MRSGELWAFSKTNASSGGSLKSAEIEGKSLLMSAGNSEGFSEESERKYSFWPLLIRSIKSPNLFFAYTKFFVLKSMCSVVAS